MRAKGANVAVPGGKPLEELSDAELERMRVQRRLNEIRTQPVGSLPMTMFFMWTVGNEISIFSIMFVGMAVWGPIQSILSANEIFSEFESDAKKDKLIGSSVQIAKLIYIGCCLVAFAVALIKLNWMGMLPVNAMDWLDNTPPVYAEHSVGRFY